MTKIPRKVGIALAITGTLFFGTLAYGVSQIKFDTVKTEIKSGVAPLEEIGPVLLNEKLADEFIQFEYEFLSAEYYAHIEEYATAHNHYEKATKSAKASLGEKSFFAHAAYLGEALAEEKNGQILESNEHFKAALKALPDLEAYNVSRCIAEEWLIYTSEDVTSPDNIPFYRKHLALVEKLQGTFTERRDLTHVLSLLAKSLDNDGKKNESEPVWRRMVNEARDKDYPKRQRVTDLIDFAYHENRAGNKTEADKALVEATAVAEQTSKDASRGEVLEIKGQIALDSGDLKEATDVYQNYLSLAQKAKNKRMLLTAYDWLAELEGRRDDLKKREEYLEKAFEFAEKPWQKYRRLPKLAVIATVNGKAELARSYVKQWKLIPKKSFQSTMFMRKKELDAFLVLHPKLSVGKLEPCKVDVPRLEGYDLSLQQLDMIMNAI